MCLQLTIIFIIYILLKCYKINHTCSILFKYILPMYLFLIKNIDHSENSLYILNKVFNIDFTNFHPNSRTNYILDG